MFHGEIQDDHQAIAREEAGCRLLPLIHTVTEEDVRENYLQVKKHGQLLLEMEF
jgi:hypothetical protein